MKTDVMQQMSVGEKQDDFKGWENVIGKGGFATVYKVESRKFDFDHAYYAIKKISLEPPENKRSNEKCASKWKKRIENEIQIHQMLKDEKIVEFHNSFEDKGFCHLVLEYCPGGSFEELLKKYKSMEFSEREEKVGPLVVEAIKGVYYIHLNGVIHRDLSTKNILISAKGNAKIADFGFAIKYDHPEEKCREKNFKEKPPCQSVLGTDPFMAPEIKQGLLYDAKVDVYSLGCVIHKMLFGVTPKNGKEVSQYASEEARELLKAMLEPDPSKRISIFDVIQNEFFKKYAGVNIPLKKSYRPNSYSDSGINSSSGSRSSQKRRGSFKHRKGEQKEKENRSISAERGYSDNYSYKQYNHSSSGHGSSRSWNQNDRNLEQRRARSPCQPRQRFSHESQYEVPMKPTPAGPDYPQYLQNVIERNNGKFSSYNSIYTDYSSIDNNKIYDSISKQGRVNTTDSYEKVKKQDLELKNSTIDRGIHNIPKPEPLTTDRLSPKRSAAISTILAILYDGRVCVEFLKGDKIHLDIVLLISPDGLEITIYKPKNKIVPSKEPPFIPFVPDNTKEVQKFCYKDLPQKHWERYRRAKLFVDAIKARTPKVTIFGEEAKCMMMERTAKRVYQMVFYDGYKITETGGTLSVIDQNGIKITKSESDYRLNTFRKMKEECLIREACEESLSNPYFPVRLGRRPNTLLKNADDNKENASPRNMHSSSGTFNIKSYSGSMNTVCSSTTNSAAANIRSPSLSRKITDVAPSLKRHPEVHDGWAVAKYEDGIQMWISMTDENKVKFRYSKGQFLKIEQHPDLQKRFERDKCFIQQYASLEVNKTK